MIQQHYLLTGRLLLVLVFSLMAAPAHADLRDVQALDKGWLFVRHEVAGAENTITPKVDWQKVELPHTWNGLDGEDGGNDYYRGVGWYRRTVSVASHSALRRYFLEFDGAALITDVWLNGEPVGRHEGGYARFRFDVTNYLRKGENTLAVRVDNRRSEQVAPLGGDFTVFGGLYRKVRLIGTNLLHIDQLDYGGPGVYITPQMIAGNASVSIRARIRNDNDNATDLTVRHTVIDQSGQVVLALQESSHIAGHTTTDLTTEGVLASPRLWQGRLDPYLYRVNTEVLENGRRVTDATSNTFGIRHMQFDPDTGFVLNGKAADLYGVNYFHAARPGKGTAVTEKDIREDMRILEELGATALRFVHFQHPQAAYNEADRIGFVVWTEIPLNAAISTAPAFLDNLIIQTRELVRQNYNHASVALWGIGNEIYASNTDTWRILKEVQAAIKADDPNRYTAYAHCCFADNDPNALIGDMIGYNRYYGWYDHEMDRIAQWADETHALVPDRTIMVSEYGAGASILHQEESPARPVPASRWHPEQYQALFHETYWRHLRTRPFVAGKIVWVGFDLASDGREEGDRPGINDKGLVTYDRKTRKEAWYWYQANWSQKPMAYITGRRIKTRTSSHVSLKAYSNLPELTLVLNGTTIDTRPVTDASVEWQGISLRPGDNIIRIESTTHGLLDQVTWTYSGPHQ